MQRKKLAKPKAKIFIPENKIPSEKVLHPENWFKFNDNEGQELGGEGSDEVSDEGSID